MQSRHYRTRRDIQHCGDLCVRQVHIVAQHDDLPMPGIEGMKRQLQYPVTVARLGNLLRSRPRFDQLVDAIIGGSSAAYEIDATIPDDAQEPRF